MSGNDTLGAHDYAGLSGAGAPQFAYQRNWYLISRGEKK